MKTVCILGPDGSGKTTVIPRLAQMLQEQAGLNTVTSSTTREIPGVPVTSMWRKQLLNPSSTTFERFNAARELYLANVSVAVSAVSDDLRDSLDILLLDRGGSSMITYNRICHTDQFSLIPPVDVGVYLDCSFERLTERIVARGTTDFQDTDFLFRKNVWENGPLDFSEWRVKADNMKGIYVDTTDKTPEQTAQALYRRILQELEIQG
jgi:thymidylate kinase